MKFLRQRADRPSSRGQALVELAIILPLLALLLVMAIDFGRVFFGWVSLTNAARIGANYAGYTPNLLTNAPERDDYETLLSDSVTGCDLEPADLNDASYDPVFTDMNGDGKANGWGDHVTVTISCELEMITPLASSMLGLRVPMNAEAVFPVRDGTFAGPGGVPPPPNPTCTQSMVPDLMNRTVGGARDKWLAEGFPLANFSTNPTSAADDWLVNSQTFTPAATPTDCVDPAIQHVLLGAVAPPPCPAGEAQVPDLIGLLVADAKEAWTDAGFTGAFKPNNAVDSKTVLTQVTSPVTSPPINGCLIVSAQVTVTYGDPPPPPCDVPNMIGRTWAEAQADWSAEGFTKALKKTGNSNAPNTVTEQTPIHPGVVGCDVDGTVKF
jgi:Flp pilus assembly protein TadG